LLLKETCFNEDAIRLAFCTFSMRYLQYVLSLLESFW
jgi:hypothetical protein